MCQRVGCPSRDWNYWVIAKVGLKLRSLGGHIYKSCSMTWFNLRWKTSLVSVIGVSWMQMQFCNFCPFKAMGWPKGKIHIKVFWGMSRPANQHLCQQLAQYYGLPHHSEVHHSTEMIALSSPFSIIPEDFFRPQRTQFRSPKWNMCVHGWYTNELFEEI